LDHQNNGKEGRKWEALGRGVSKNRKPIKEKTAKKNLKKKKI